ncbi:hypothetical protein [Streptomyces sirii]|uniref:hypothetical protein n=1 Tax=Streptomyces sirii TaxID=3127701 RepID=UPI003D36FE5E
MSFAVPRLRLSEGRPVSYTVVGDDGLPIEALEDLLADGDHQALREGAQNAAHVVVRPR